MSDATILIGGETINVTVGDGTAQRGETGAQGAAGTANELIVSRSENYPYVTFDQPEGTVIANGFTTESGHTLSVAHLLAGTATIALNGLISTDLFYFGLTHSALIDQAWGAVSFLNTGSGGDTGAAAVLILNGNGPVDVTGGLIHAIFTPVGTTLQVSMTGGLGLTAAGGTTEVIYGGTRDGGQIPRDGRPLPVGLQYIQKASAALDELIVYHPSGRITKHVGETMFRAVMATCRWATGETTATVTNGFQAKWHAFQLGRRRSDVLLALAGGARKVDVQEINNLSEFQRRQRVSFTPSTAGWYPVATAVNTGAKTLMGGTVKIGDSDNSGRDHRSEIVFGMEGTERPILERCETLFGRWSGQSPVDQIRFSHDGSASGLKQLEVHVYAVASATLDRVNVDLDGIFTAVAAPVVGSTALGGFSRTQNLLQTKAAAAHGGNADFTMTPGVDPVDARLTTTTTATRKIKLDSRCAVAGDEFRLSRPSAGPTGDYDVVDYTADTTVLKTIAPGTWAHFRWNGATFVLVAYGTL